MREYFLSLGPGKLRGLQRVADAGGRFKILALDQAVVFDTVFHGDRFVIAQRKMTLLNALGPYASSVLLDAPTSARLAINSALLPREAGLVVRLEKACRPGDYATEEPGWSVAKIKRMGADALKVFVYMDVDNEKYTTAQLDFIKRTAEACQEHDILMLTEALTFPRMDASEPDGAGPAYQQRRVKNIFRYAELLGPHTDILKLEFPGEQHVEELDRSVQRPWVLIGSGVEVELLKAQAEKAMNAGASGLMAARSIFTEWLESHSPDFQSPSFLDEVAVSRMQLLGRIVDRGSSWLDRCEMSRDDLASVVKPGESSTFRAG